MINVLKYGNTNTFIIKGSNCNLLIDTDYAGTLSNFYKAIKEINIKVSDIKYVLATHYHPDHIGLISELMKQGVKLVLVDFQKQFVHFSDKIFKKDKHLNYEVINENNAIIISIEESRNFLKNMGINGEIIKITSHSDDSISIILDNGECIVGDLEPYEFTLSYINNKKLESDWNKIYKYNPKVINYSHRPKKEL